MKPSWRQVVPICITLSAMLAGFYSMLMTAAGEHAYAAQLIMLSMVLDGLDGTVARLMKGTSEFGAELDTYVDMSSFGLAPGLLAYESVLKDFGLWGLLFVSVLVLSGVVRLSRFRVVDPHRGQQGYLGLPITVSAGWIAMFVLVTESGVRHAEWFTLHSGPLAIFVWGCVLVYAVLQVSTVRYIKPTKHPLSLIPCILGVVLLFFKVGVAVSAALAICAYGFYYAFISPFIHKQPGQSA